jgi:hypothetical protein
MPNLPAKGINLYYELYGPEDGDVLWSIRWKGLPYWFWECES